VNRPQVYNDRPIIVLQLPLDDGVAVKRPEQIVLRVGRATFDIGAFCYADRELAVRGGNRIAQRGVVLKSLLPHRPDQIRKVIDYISSLLTDRGLRIETVTTFFKYFTAYMNWADSNGYFNCLGNDASTRSVLEAWLLECEEQFKKGVWSGSHAWANQSGITILLSSISGKPGLRKGLRFLKFRPTNTGTDPAPEGDFAMVLSISEALFTGLSDLIIENRPFPFRLDMPVLPGWNDSQLWLFPTHRWYLAPHLQGDARKTLQKPLWAYDYVNGCISSFEEIKQHFKMPCLARLSIRQANDAIDRANTDQRNLYRRQAAQAAHDCFLLLFIAHTGLNEAVVRDIRWDGEIIAEAKQQGFREVKWRASGKTVSALIRARFLPLLKIFLELRKYILDGESYEWLFIGGDRRMGKYCQMTKGALERQHRLAASIYPPIPRIGGRKLRATMHEWYNRNVDPALTARITGHTQETVDKHYQAGTVGAHREEVTTFLNKVADRAKTIRRVVPNEERLAGATKGPLGVCEKQGGPIPISDASAVTPTCKEAEGCLFCKRHAVKADEEDVRKLASCAYVIEQTLYFPGAESHFRPTLTLIDEYLRDIKVVLRSPDMVDRVTADVYEHGNLDPYWAGKLTLLDSIGVIQ
jgi:hypothetical protein